VGVTTFPDRHEEMLANKEQKLIAEHKKRNEE
jgi:hypothetical protein